MLAPTDVVPEYYEFTAIRGTTFRRTITLFTDEAKKVRRNLAGLEISLTLKEYLTLTRGTGLEINDAQGEITIVLTPTQTQKAPGDEIDQFLVVSTKIPEDAIIPVDGKFIFLTP